MYARVITFTGANNIDDGLTFVQEKVLPQVANLQGYRGLSISADRQGGVFGILGLWETEADREASYEPLAGARQEGLSIVGGEMTIENFEQVVLEVGDPPPAPGCTLIVQRVSVNPAAVDDEVAFFKSEVVPSIKANAGFRGLRNLLNRETAQAVVGTVWTDADSAHAALAAGQQRRQQATDRGVTFGETSEREILFTDLR